MRKDFSAVWQAYFNPDLRPELNARWITPQVLENVLAYLPDSVKRTVIGRSAEGRPVHQLQLGTGAKNVLAWAAMHGNETTAMRGWLDLFLAIENPAIQSYYDDLLAEFTIYFIPLLNPDGAQRFTRRNAMGLDMNRDARVLQTPEMQLLSGLISNLKPVLAFNLHDQRNIFTAGDKPATLSFLAPSVDEARTVTLKRAQTMDLIGAAATAIKPVLTGGIGRYTDEYYPTAIGEWVQQQDIPAILVECGPATNDPLRNEARMVNPIILHAVLTRFSAKQNPDTSTYNSIPVNLTNQVDVLIKGVITTLKGFEATIDIALLAEESVQNNIYTRTLKMHDVGDLRQLVGLETYTWKSTIALGSLSIGSVAEMELITDKGRISIEAGSLKTG